MLQTRIHQLGCCIFQSTDETETLNSVSFAYFTCCKCVFVCAVCGWRLTRPLLHQVFRSCKSTGSSIDIVDACSLLYRLQMEGEAHTPPRALLEDLCCF